MINLKYKNNYIDINENNSSIDSKKDELKLDCINLIMDSISNCKNEQNLNGEIDLMKEEKDYADIMKSS